mmetsp:Transcript_23815/g.53267  ORF Transcript_23815/g.53267 Transcript_23815/m.53267 type:complete len:237 (-) Transcript_23815:110-820(-)
MSDEQTKITANIMDYMSYLLGLIERRDWLKFSQVALSSPKSYKFICEIIDRCAEFHGMTLLHAVARYDPPVDLVKSMIELYPSALRSEDCLGRTPLHVAAGSDASPRVIKLLVCSFPGACSLQDEDGRTALHFVCDTSCELFEDDVPRERRPPGLDVVKVLLAGSLDSVTLEDRDEMNAVEYAICSGASMDVVNLLQKATQRVMKKSAKLSEGRNTSLLSRELSSSSQQQRISLKC